MECERAKNVVIGSVPQDSVSDGGEVVRICDKASAIRKSLAGKRFYSMDLSESGRLKKARDLA